MLHIRKENIKIDIFILIIAHNKSPREIMIHYNKY